MPYHNPRVQVQELSPTSVPVRRRRSTDLGPAEFINQIKAASREHPGSKERVRLPSCAQTGGQLDPHSVDGRCTDEFG